MFPRCFLAGRGVGNVAAGDGDCVECLEKVNIGVESCAILREDHEES